MNAGIAPLRMFEAPYEIAKHEMSSRNHLTRFATNGLDTATAYSIAFESELRFKPALADRRSIRG